MVAGSNTDTDIPSAEDQKVFVKKWYSKKVELDQTWYIIDMKWFRQWKDYVRWESRSQSSNEAPGCMNNQSIMDAEGNLRERLMESVDIEVLPSEIWEYFVKIYGVENGQSPIRCPVIDIGTFNASYQVEIYGTKVYLSHYKSPTQGEHTLISRSWTVQSLMDLMKKKYNIAQDVDTRLYSSYLSSSYDHMGTPTKPLYRYQLSKDQFIVISEKVDGHWPEISPYKNKTGVFKSSTSSNIGTSTIKPTKSTSDSSLSSSSYPSTSSYNTRASNGWSSSSYKDPSVDPGLCGLSNLGNTCFMNSALQCMTNCPELKDFFYGSWKDEVNEKNPLGMGGEMASSFANLLHEMWSGKSGHTNPGRFKHAVGKFAPRFSGYAQQDSQELMAFLLDGLHEDLNRVKDKKTVPPRESNGEPDEQLALASWKDYELRNRSIIVDLFHGQLKSRLECPNESCGHVSVTFDPFCYLSLPLPIKTTKNLEVTYFSLDRSRQPIKMRVKVPKNGNVDDICTVVGEIVKKPREMLCVAEVYHSKFHRIYERRNDVKNITDRDTIHVFEIDAASERVTVGIYFRTYSGNARLTAVFGNPTILSLPRFIDSEQQLYKIIRQAIDQYINKEEENKIMHAHQEEIQLDANPPAQQDDPMGDNGLNDSEKMETQKTEDCASPKPVPEVQTIFKVSPINAYGSSEKLKTAEDGRIELTERCYLAVDFDKSIKSRILVNEKMEIEPESHSSLTKREEQKNRLQLSDCLRKFSEREQLDETNTWYCSRCEKHVPAYKTMDIWSTPKYMVVQLKRFQQSKWAREKIDTFIDYPVRDLDMSNYIKNTDQKLTRYNLIAVSNHFGGLGGGHYTAYAKNHKLNRWYYFDDSSVSSVDENQVVSKSGYILIYERQPPQSTTSTDSPADMD